MPDAAQRPQRHAWAQAHLQERNFPSGPQLRLSTHVVSHEQSHRCSLAAPRRVDCSTCLVWAPYANARCRPERASPASGYRLNAATCAGLGPLTGAWLAGVPLLGESADVGRLKPETQGAGLHGSNGRAARCCMRVQVLALLECRRGTVSPRADWLELPGFGGGSQAVQRFSECRR